MRGTVIAVDQTEKEVVVRTDAGAQRLLEAAYVAEHLQHAYALTAHTIQGATVEWAGVVGRPEDFTRNWSYTALSRAREPTELFVIDTPTERELDRTEIAPRQPADSATSAPPLERLAARHAPPRRRGPRARPRRHRAHPRSRSPRAHARAGCLRGIARPSVTELQAELAQLRERIGRYPDHLADQLHAARSARAEAQRVADAARARITELEQPAPGVLRRRPRGPRRTRAASANASSSPSRKSRRPPSVSATSRRAFPTARQWDAERRALRERAAELDTQLSIRRREHLRVALERPAALPLRSAGRAA